MKNTHRYIFSLLILLAFLLPAACLSPWQGDEKGVSFTITIGDSSQSSAARSVDWDLDWNPNAHLGDLTHVITLSNGPGPDQKEIVKSSTTVRFFVAAGNWTIEIKSYLDWNGTSGVLVAQFNEVKNIYAGIGTIPVQMKKPEVFLVRAVTLNAGGGTFADGGNEITVHVPHDARIQRPVDPERYNNELNGWYKDTAFTDSWDFYSDTVTENITLYAKWSSVSFPPHDPIYETYFDGLILDNVELDDYYEWFAPGTFLDAGDNQEFRAIFTDLSGNRHEGDIIVNVAPASITNVAVAITPPIAGATPNTTATPAGGSNFSAETVVWDPVITDDIFQGSQVYTATVTLTANANYTFTGLTDSGITISETTTRTITGTTGNTVTVTATFPATAPLITITTQPNVTTNVYQGGAGSLTVAASVTEGGAPLSYQWYERTIESGETIDTAISSSTTTSYNTLTTLLPGTYYYFVEVSGTGGAVPVRSNVATVNVALPLLTGTVTIQIRDPYGNPGTWTDACEGEILYADTSALGGTGTITYTWRRGASVISSANSSTYTLGSLDPGLGISVMVTREGNSGNRTSDNVGVFAVPYGTAVRPWRIYSEEDLRKVGTETGEGWNRTGDTANYRQMRNIILTGTNWTPIGTSGSPFTGTYDGRGFTITGLTIASTEAGQYGMFGAIGAGSIVKNLGLRNVEINVNNTTVTNRVGGIAGVIEGVGGTVQNCNVTGSIQGSVNVGGIAGRLENSGLIENCHSAATVTVIAGTNRYGGGIVGYNSSTVRNCYFTGAVSTPTPGSNSNYVGGIVGFNATRVVNCYAVGSVSVTYPTDPGTGHAVGGIVGLSNSAVAYNCVALNSSISISDIATSVSRGSVAGIGTSGSFLNNYARVMDLGGTGIQGTPVDVFPPTAGWWTDANRWYAATNDNPLLAIDVWDFNNVWIMGTVNVGGTNHALPVLRNMPLP